MRARAGVERREGRATLRMESDIDKNIDANFAAWMHRYNTEFGCVGSIQLLIFILWAFAPVVVEIGWRGLPLLRASTLEARRCTTTSSVRASGIAYTASGGAGMPPVSVELELWHMVTSVF